MVRRYKFVGNGSYNGVCNSRGKTIGKPTTNGWGTVSVKVNKNRERKREEGYLRIPPFSSAFFCENTNFVERISDEVVYFRAASSWIAGTLQFQVTGSWLAETP